MTIINTSVIMDIATDAVAILVVIGNSFAGAFPGSVSPGSEGLLVSLLPDLGSFVPRHCFRYHQVCREALPFHIPVCRKCSIVIFTNR